MKKSFAQEGQDLILQSIFRDVKNGCYLEIGAYQPVKQSNTYAMYLNGWTGVCVDGNNAYKDDWQKLRPKDKFLNYLVSDKKRDVELFLFPESHNTMNSIDLETVERYSKRFQPHEINKETRTTVPISDLLDEYFNNQELHLLCLDVEGSELDILKGMNFDMYIPGVIVAEVKNFNFSFPLEQEVNKFLYDLGYKLIAKSPLDSFFIFPDKEYLDWIPRKMLG